MIIAINGRVGSGKDTTGAIIRGTSKQTWDIKKFAGKLKQIAGLMLGVPPEKFEDQEYKKTFLPKEWNTTIFNNSSGLVDVSHSDFMEQQMTVREFLQKLGTAAVRNHVHDQAWVNALFADYRKRVVVEGEDKVASDGGYYTSPSYSEYPNWLITDCRFPNEADTVKKKGGLVIRVTRPQGNLTDLHPSETSLDGYSFDYVINNDGPLDTLLPKVKIFLNEFNID
jgi:hypothetical protein